HGQEIPRPNKNYDIFIFCFGILLEYTMHLVLLFKCFFLVFFWYRHIGLLIFLAYDVYLSWFIQQGAIMFLNLALEEVGRVMTIFVFWNVLLKESLLLLSVKLDFLLFSHVNIAQGLKDTAVSTKKNADLMYKSNMYGVSGTSNSTGL
ncbi:hypothetical protein ACJX0J_023205, partial [Zea mays]